MRELYLVACGLIIGLSVRDWWNRLHDDLRAEAQYEARAAVLSMEDRLKAAAASTGPTPA